MEKPLVTVVTITYNLINAGREKFIRQCIDCVRVQTYKNVEHIIIDGASTDGTLKIFKDYPWLKVFSEPDKGIYDAMNKGVAKASGKYIVFLNSDDFWHDNRAVEESVKVLEENNADFSYAPCTYLDENNKFVGYLYPTMETFFAWMPFCHQTMFTKTELVKFDDSYKSAGDFDFVLNLILSGAKGVFVPLNFTTFRWIGMSSGLNDDFGNKNGIMSAKEQVRAAKYALCKKYNIPEKVIDEMYNFERIKKSFVENIIRDLDSHLAVSIKKYISTQKSKVINLDLKPFPRKIHILFNAADIYEPKAQMLLDSILGKEDCKISLYMETSEKLPEKYKTLPLFEGRIRDTNAFCSPVSPVPTYIRQSNIPVLKSLNDLSYEIPKYIKNIVIKGSYKIKAGRITIFEVKANHGTLTYYLFKLFLLFKIVYKESKKSFRLF